MAVRDYRERLDDLLDEIWRLQQELQSTKDTLNLTIDQYERELQQFRPQTTIAKPFTNEPVQLTWDELFQDKYQKTAEQEWVEAMQRGEFDGYLPATDNDDDECGDCECGCNTTKNYLEEE